MKSWLFWAWMSFEGLGRAYGDGFNKKRARGEMGDGNCSLATFRLASLACMHGCLYKSFFETRPTFQTMMTRCAR